MKEDKASRVSFFRWLRGRGLAGVRLVVGDRCLGMLEAVGEELRSMKRKEAAKKVADGIEETLTHCDFPSEHRTRIRTNNAIERLNREIRRRTCSGNIPSADACTRRVAAYLMEYAEVSEGYPLPHHLFLNSPGVTPSVFLNSREK